MVNAFHSSGLEEGGQVVYAGEPAGYVVRLENGLTLYHAGDTCVFGDMRIIGELYQPDVAMLPVAMCSRWDARRRMRFGCWASSA